MRIQSINRYRVKSLFHADRRSNAGALSGADMLGTLLFDTERYSERLDSFPAGQKRLYGIKMAREA